MKVFTLLVLGLLTTPLMAANQVCGDPFRADNFTQIDKIKICVGIDECYYQDFKMDTAKSGQPEKGSAWVELDKVDVDALFKD